MPHLPPVKKDFDAPPAFPAATQTGLNTMGAIINNNQFIVYQLPGSIRPSLIVQYSDHSFTISGVDPSSNFSAFLAINLYNVQGIGKYPLANELENNMFEQNWAQLVVGTSNQIHYQTDSVNYGSVTITRFDTLKHIISGTFSLAPKMYGMSSSVEIASVQNGRFDVTYVPPQ